MKTHLFILNIFLFGGLLLSCSDIKDNSMYPNEQDPPVENNDNDDDDDDSPVSTAILLPVTIIEEYDTGLSTGDYTPHKNTTSFTYDSSNRIIEQKSIYEVIDKPVRMTLSVFTYDAQGKIKQIEKSEFQDDNFIVDYIETYTYNDNIIEIQQNNSLIKKLELNEKGQAIKNIQYYETRIYEQNCQYDENGNLISNLTSTNPTQEQTFIYNRKNGIYKHVNTPTWYIVSTFTSNYSLQQHLKKSNLTYTDIEETVPFYLIESEYNEDDYPISIVYNPDSRWEGLISMYYKVEYMPGNDIN